MKFSIGYNHDIHLLKLLDSFKEHLEGIYFPIPNEFMGSGRAIPQEREYKEEIKQIINFCRKNNLRSLLLLNPTCEGKNTAKSDYMQKIISYIKGISPSGVIVTNPVWIPEIKEKLPNIEIHTSINCYTKSVEQAMYLKELGADVLTLDRDINRDLDLIKLIKEKTKLKIKLLANEGCLKNCPFRQAHFNMISHGADTIEFDRKSCISILKKYPERFFKIPFIRPEDIKHYINLADIIKLSTRSMDTVRIGILLDAYISQKWEGDLLFLLSGKGIFEQFSRIDNQVLEKNDFFNKISNCNEDCNSCSYCKELLQKV